MTTKHKKGVAVFINKAVPASNFLKQIKQQMSNDLYLLTGKNRSSQYAKDLRADVDKLDQMIYDMEQVIGRAVEMIKK